MVLNIRQKQIGEQGHVGSNAVLSCSNAMGSLLTEFWD